MLLSPNTFFGKQIAFLFVIFNPFGRLPFYPIHILLFFGLFMNRSFATPFAVFFQFNFALNFLFVFARPVIGSFAIGALQLY
jgi:hypothetical protein